MKTLLRNLIILLLLLSHTLPSQAQKVLSDIIKSGEIKIGMTGDQPPFAMRAKSGELIGFEVDLANALAQSIGVKVKIVEIPFAGLMDALKAGKVHMVMSGMTITAQRNLHALFAGPYMLSGKTILTKSRLITEIRAAQAGNSQDKKFKVVALKGSTSADFTRDNMPNFELIQTDNYDLAVDMVLNDKVHAMVADLPICVVSVLKHQGKDLVASENPMTIEPIGMALSPDDPQFLNLVSNYLASLELSGFLNLLQKKWFEDGKWLINVN
ncbi:MAG: transporter substrate-binding domain-containing protein [Cyclobacteriaceae bacterium]|nr:transporter substrate-binding domain-containing protein [Cyclobacteriaceae bacterium]